MASEATLATELANEALEATAHEERTVVVGGTDWPMVDLNIDLIETDKTLQARVRMDPAHVERLKEVVEKKQPRRGDPAVVFKVKDAEGADHYLTADGFHWIQAHRELGRRRVHVQLREGTRTDALRYALSANATHGLPRTTADKERAVELALKDEDIGNKSTKFIARLCQVSEGLAARVREAYDKEQGAKAKQRVGEDGRVRKASIVRKDSASRKAAKEVSEAAGKIATAKDPERIAVPEAGKVKVRGMVDAAGREVPETLGHVFKAKVQVGAGTKMLGNILALVGSLRESGALAWASKALESNLKAAREELEAAEPHVICDSCKGEGCRFCKAGGQHQGWLSVGYFNSLTKVERERILAAPEAEKDAETAAAAEGPEVAAV